MEGPQVADACGPEILEAGGDRALRVLALPLQADVLFWARVGSGAVEGGLHALAKVRQRGNGGSLGRL